MVDKDPEGHGGGHGGGGNEETLRKYWTEGKGAIKIRWGEPNDYYRCLTELGKYVPPSEVHGMCQNLHIRALGYATATHAKMVREAEGKEHGK